MHGEKRRRLARDAFFQDAEDRKNDASLATSLTGQGVVADANVQAAVEDRKKAFGAMLQGADVGPPVRELDQFEQADQAWKAAVAAGQNIAAQKGDVLSRIGKRRSSLLPQGSGALDAFKKIPHSWERR